MALIGEIYRPDLAVLSIGDFYTMGPLQAAHAVRLLGVKHVVGGHWGTFPGLTGTPAGPARGARQARPRGRHGPRGGARRLHAARGLSRVGPLDDILADSAPEAGEAVRPRGRALPGGRPRAARRRCRRRTPEVQERFDEPAPARGRPFAEVLARVEGEVIPSAAWLHDPMHMAHQLSCPLPAAIWTEPVVAALNQSMAVAELSPSGDGHRAARAALAGRPRGAAGRGGRHVHHRRAWRATFTALAAARARLWPDAWERGVGGPRGGRADCGQHDALLGVAGRGRSSASARRPA